MQFIIDESPDATKWPSGSQLTLSETAQLLELDTAELLSRTRSAMVLREQGFSFHIQREGQTQTGETDFDRSLYDPEKENDAAYSRLKNQLDEVHMALEQSRGPASGHLPGGRPGIGDDRSNEAGTGNLGKALP